MTRSWTRSRALMTQGLRMRPSQNQANVAYIMKIMKYFCENVVFIMFMLERKIVMKKMSNWGHGLGLGYWGQGLKCWELGLGLERNREWIQQHCYVPFLDELLWLSQVPDISIAFEAFLKMKQRRWCVTLHSLYFRKRQSSYIMSFWQFYIDFQSAVFRSHFQP